VTKIAVLALVAALAAVGLMGSAQAHKPKPAKKAKP
jgi:hypothetical protein